MVLKDAGAQGLLKDAIAKNFVANERRSFTFVFTFSVVVVYLPTDRILTFLFPAETDVHVPVFSQSTDVVVVNFVVVLKFPIVPRGSSRRYLLFFVPYFSNRLDFPSPPLSKYIYYQKSDRFP